MKKICFIIFLNFIIIKNAKALPDCDKSIHFRDWTNCSGIMELANGERYNGEWKNGLKHGKGNLKYSNGEEYEGNFKGGKPYGNG